MSTSTEAVVTLTHTDAAAEWANSTERKPIFSVARPNPEYATENGDGSVAEAPAVIIDTYTMPAKPNPGLALDYLRRARREGELATAWLIETAVGEKGYDALVNELIGYDGDPVALLQSIVQKIQKVAMGGLDVPKG